MNTITRKRLRAIKDSMMARCYNKKNAKYKNYGARGVTVADEWQTLAGFIEGVTSLPSWNEEEFLKGALQLDKDLKIKGNKTYSVDTCKWVSPQENAKVKPSYQKPIIAVNSAGDSYRFGSLVEMSEKLPQDKYNWYKSGIVPVLKGTRQYHNDWYAYYEGTSPKYPLVYEVYDGVVSYKSFKQSTLERKIGASTGTINKRIKNKAKSKYKGRWEIVCYPLSENTRVTTIEK